MKISTLRIAWILGLLETACIAFAALWPKDRGDVIAAVLTIRGAFEYIRYFLANNPFPKV